MTSALELRGVTKAFGPTRAVEDLDLTIPRGMTCGVIGPSGAGKTTAIRMIMAILFPDCGELSVLGQRSALEAKNRIGYLPEERGVYQKMKVGAFLSYLAQLKGVPFDEARTRASHLLDRVGLGGTEKKKLEDLSKGMVHRVQFVGAIINQPELLILDEPFSGLDPVSVKTLRQILAEEHARGTTILFSTHVMANAEELCQHVVMIHKGRKVLDEPMAGLRRQYNLRTILFEPLAIDADISPLRGVDGVEQIVATLDGYEIRIAEGRDPVAAIRAIASTVPPARIEIARVRLEDVFIRLVTGSAPESERALREQLHGQGVEGALA